MSQDLSFGRPFDMTEMLDSRLGYFNPVIKSFFYYVVPLGNYLLNSIRSSMAPTRLDHLLSRMAHTVWV